MKPTFEHASEVLTSGLTPGDVSVAVGGRPSKGWSIVLSRMARRRGWALILLADALDERATQDGSAELKTKAISSAVDRALDAGQAAASWRSSHDTPQESDDSDSA